MSRYKKHRAEIIAYVEANEGCTAYACVLDISFDASVKTNTIYNVIKDLCNDGELYRTKRAGSYRLYRNWPALPTEGQG